MITSGAPGTGAWNDRGSAVAEFTLVSVLLLVLVLGVAQLGLAIHVRNTLVACAAEGARVAANADRSPESGAARARDLISSSLSDSYAADVRAGYVERDGVVLARVDVRAPLPLLGLAGPDRVIEVSGHAMAESAP
jgi:Flp pilus assembly protein TadG